MSWRVCDGIFLETIDDEMIVLDGAGNTYLTLNETGAAILESIADGDDLPAIGARLTAGWDVDEEEALEFADAFIQDLLNRGIVEEKVGG